MKKYRDIAREAIARAKSELAADDPLRYRYAALEIREAIEALVYERATVFRNDVLPEQLKVWQPRKLMQLLISVDPAANMGCSIRIGEHGPNNELPAEMKPLGTETVLRLQDFKDYYDALGSFLHVLTIAQIDEGRTHDLKKLKAKCDELIPIIEAVLKSQLFNVHIRNTATTNCMRCEFQMTKRFPLGSKKVDVECFNCSAPYLLEDVGKDEVRWWAKKKYFKCEEADCGRDVGYWLDQVKEGVVLDCEGCNKKYQIQYAVFAEGN
jgi:transcription elongation factor Elf1